MKPGDLYEQVLPAGLQAWVYESDEHADHRIACNAGLVVVPQNAVVMCISQLSYYMRVFWDDQIIYIHPNAIASGWLKPLSKENEPTPE